jgi:hypothetical protein
MTSRYLYRTYSFFLTDTSKEKQIGNKDLVVNISNVLDSAFFEPVRYRILRTVPLTLPLRLICLCAGERLLGLQIQSPELE